MTIQEMVRKYAIAEGAKESTISILYNGKISTAEIEMLKAAKPEIIAYLKAERQAQADALTAYEAKINSIEGLKEIENLQGKWESYKAAFDRMMDTGAGYMDVTKPEIQVSELMAKYPRAASYLKAQSYSMASNYEKATAGKNAVERILNGDDYNMVIAEMDAQWTKAAKKAVWNS